MTLWRDVLASGLRPGPLTAGPDDLCVMPYTSGTTGQPKGCMHTHRSVMHTLVGSMRWFAMQPEITLMAVAPLFHVTGMQGGMNGPLYVGNTVVMLPRWDRNAAARVRAALPGCELDRGADHDPGFFREPQHRQVRLELDTALERRRRRHAGRGGATAARHGRHLLRGLWTVGNHGGHAHQSARASQEAVLGHSDL